MTEQEWLRSTDALTMWRDLEGAVSNRKSRLFAIACCRRIWPLLLDQASRAAVELAERSADEPISESELDLASGSAEGAYEESMTDENGVFRPDEHPITSAAYAASYASNPVLRSFDVDEVMQAAVTASSIGAFEEFMAQAKLLRDIVRNPWQTTPIELTWLDWNDRLIVKLAQGIYEDRAFDRMPILGDALEDAGCTDAALLDHLRSPGPHVRGCWALDLVLSKE